MPFLAFSQLPFTAALLLLFAGRQLDAKSVIVDDADTSRITYSSGWNIGNNCTGCFAQPDSAQASNRTWHDGTASNLFTPFFTFTFTGTSIEARYIAIDIIQTAFSFTTGTNASYLIDGTRLGTTVRDPANRGAYVYNQSLFSVDGLANGEHTLRVELLRGSVLLLDYLVYDDGSAVTSTTVTSTTSSTSSSSTPSNISKTSSTPSTNIGAIVGGIVAGVVVLVLGVVLLWYFKRRRREISRRRRPPILGSGPNSPVSGTHETTERGPFSSHFYAPSTIASQVTHNFSQTGQTPTQQFNNKAAIYNSAGSGSNSSGAPHTPSATHTSSTIPQSPSAKTRFSSAPSGSEAPQGFRVNEKPPHGLPRFAVQNPTTPGPPPSSFNSGVVAGSVQGQIHNEPVEEGLMTRQLSTRTILPPYSPGGFQHDGGMPPLPER